MECLESYERRIVVRCLPNPSQKVSFILCRKGGEQKAKAGKHLTFIPFFLRAFVILRDEFRNVIFSRFFDLVVSSYYGNFSLLRPLGFVANKRTKSESQPSIQSQVHLYKRNDEENVINLFWRVEVINFVKRVELCSFLLFRFIVDVIAPLGVSDFVLDALVVLAFNLSFLEERVPREIDIELTFRSTVCLFKPLISGWAKDSFQMFVNDLTDSASLCGFDSKLNSSNHKNTGR